MSEQWREDVLGPGYEQLTMPLRAESEGVEHAPVATLVRHLPQRRRWWQRKLPLQDVDVL